MPHTAHGLSPTPPRRPGRALDPTKVTPLFPHHEAGRKSPGRLLVARLAAVFPGLADLEGRLSPRSLREYVYDAKLYVAFVGNPAAVLDPASLRRWRQHMVRESRISPNTINRRLVAVKTLVKASAACGAVSAELAGAFALVERVKVAALRDRLKPSTRTLLTPAQVRALCRAPDASTLIGLRDRAFLFTLASSGARLSEVVGLRREDLVPMGAAWVLSILGKGEAHRRLAPLTTEALAWLRRWLRARDSYLQSRWLFTAIGPHEEVTGSPLSSQGAFLLTKRYTTQIGLGHISPHHFRRFVATRVYERHGLRVAQKTLGHKLLTTTLAHYILDTISPEVTEGLF